MKSYCITAAAVGFFLTTMVDRTNIIKNYFLVKGETYQDENGLCELFVDAYYDNFIIIHCPVFPQIVFSTRSSSFSNKDVYPNAFASNFLNSAFNPIKIGFMDHEGLTSASTVTLNDNIYYSVSDDWDTLSVAQAARFWFDRL